MKKFRLRHRFYCFAPIRLKSYKKIDLKNLMVYSDKHIVDVSYNELANWICYLLLVSM